MIITALYAPADRPERLPKAFDSAADAVLVDLEDAVAASRKDWARQQAASVLAAAVPPKPCQVRINASGTPWHEADLAMVAELPAGVGVRVPKCEDPVELARLTELLTGRAIHVLVESAVGVEALGDLARVPGVATIGLGEADLRSDLSLVDDQALDWIRTRAVVAARAAGLPAPWAAAFTDVADLDGLATSTRRLARRGFVGRTVIHPRQIEVVRQAFRPDEQAVARARGALSALAEAQRLDSGVAVLPDGTFLDPAMVALHQRTVELAEQLG